MNLRVLGCDGGVSQDHHNVSFLINDRVALDAGHLASGLSLSEQDQIECILLTHSHMDHVRDLPAICDTRLLQSKSPLVIAGLNETIHALKEHLFNNVVWPDLRLIAGKDRAAIELRVLEPEVTVKHSKFTIRPIPVNHTVPAGGYVIDSDDKSVAYSGDTRDTDRFWDVLNAQEKLSSVITEVAFPDRLSEIAKASGHLTPATLRDQLQKLKRVEDLSICIFGLKPTYQDEIRSELVALGLANVQLLSSGDVIEL